MYEQFYGLTELPFELTANPKYLFLTKGQREALSNLQYGLLSARSLTLLIGDAGTGKTTLIRAALESERCRGVRCIYLNNPVLRADEFMRLLALKFDLGAEVGRVQAAAPRATGAAAARTARRRRNYRARHRRGAKPQCRAARGSPPPREHRDSVRQAAAARSRRPTRVGSQARRSEPAPAETTRHAAMRARAVRIVGHCRLHCQPHPHGRRRTGARVQPGCRHAHPSIFARNPANDQRHLRQRPDHGHGAWQ